MRVWGLAAGVALSVLLGAVATGQQATGGEPLKWFKGNTHTHTTLSDGDSPPETVAKWYKDHGYQFVVMTDHNKTGDGGMQARFGGEGRFLVITGNEISCVSEGKPVHLTAVNPSGVLVQLNDAGLRGRVTPLLGISYTL